MQNNSFLRFLCCLLFVTAVHPANASCVAGEKKITNVGTELVCDASIPGFGEAYKDPWGQIWTSVVQKLNLYEATAHCKSIGGRVPNAQDWLNFYDITGVPRDYDACRTKGFCYNPYLKNSSTEILTGLLSKEIWSTYTFGSGHAHTFNGYTGAFGGVVMEALNKISVVCVADGQ